MLCLFYGALDSKGATIVEVTGKNYDIEKLPFFVTDSSEIGDEFSLEEGSFLLLK